VHAIVMAAGEGRRLRPLTERWPKAVLPIEGKPVIGTLLRELASAGVDRAVVVTGHLAEQVEGLVEDGGAFGLHVSYARQPGAFGSADAVTRALDAGAEPPCIAVAADTVFRPGDARRFWDDFAARDLAGAIAVRRDPPPSPGKPAVRIRSDGLVERVVDDDPENPVGSAPLWAIGPTFVHYLADLPGPPYELAVAAQRAVDAGAAIAAVEIGRTRDLTHPVDLVERNFPYLGGT
jgi:UDP-N-acetylglucosamine diphosphorylase / glucose-1-phosphate thymidylyltransferase / UDP-N-acetylgalactosamine diphosphorylase / glucosamine-1-phosphate N-acetyltransferase / galactosamine-1-phosphate N-acetyltransferase